MASGEDQEPAEDLGVCLEVHCVEEGCARVVVGSR